jgi:hypothetical protein
MTKPSEAAMRALQCVQSAQRQLGETMMQEDGTEQMERLIRYALADMKEAHAILMQREPFKLVGDP